jgi:hypothetical protein
MIDDPDVQAARAALVSSTHVVTALRNNVLVQQLLRAFRKSPHYQCDDDALMSEMQEIIKTCTFKHLHLDGVDGLNEQQARRSKLDGARTRLVRMNRELRSLKMAVRKAKRDATVYLRQQPEMAALTAKTSEEVLALVLQEFTDLGDTVDNLLVETKDVLSLMDQNVDTIGSWFSMHKQYVFLTLAHKSGREPGGQYGDQTRR